MKHLTLFLLLFIICLATLYAQKNDYHWITGYDGGDISINQPWFGLSVLKFSDFGKLDTVNLQEPNMDMGFLNVSISSDEGNLQFYSNGVGLNNHFHELMENGDGMSGFPGSTGEEGGYGLRQGGIGVVWPDLEEQYFFY